MSDSSSSDSTQINSRKRSHAMIADNNNHSNTNSSAVDDQSALSFILTALTDAVDSHLKHAAAAAAASTSASSSSSRSAAPSTSLADDDDETRAADRSSSKRHKSNNTQPSSHAAFSSVCSPHHTRASTLFAHGLLHVYSYLTVKEVNSALQTCHHWRSNLGCQGNLHLKFHSSTRLATVFDLCRIIQSPFCRHIAELRFHLNAVDLYLLTGLPSLKKIINGRINL